jgi:hypothetical protein
MLRDLPDLLPEKRTKLAMADNTGQKSKETGKAAQERVMAMMRQKQRNFAASIDQSEATTTEAKMDEECIICRCDDADGQNNGPLGYLLDTYRNLGLLKCELFLKRTTAITLSSSCCCWCSLFLFFSFAK